ncbi:MAG: hypothetical protein KC684_08015 [Candidatus Omnitrophica bacterium]|nr:hypothetical protein [Candidatus Omnitrophota bacterium]
MGTAFSIDTPVKVAHYGISSVISLVDDSLIEEMRKHYCALRGEVYTPITKYDHDYRARRITEYLNLVDRIVAEKFEQVRNSCFEIGSEITKYFEMISNNSPIKQLYQQMIKIQDPILKRQLQDRLRSMMRPGDINVNIMTKLDRDNLDAKKNPLPAEFSDALSALRGYAESTLNSAIVFSAGINRRLYSYVEKFDDFYADAAGFIKKRIILKVSDYRSSIIQGRFFAKKGLWISEYRVESGLNCGGHAFASDGYLMGPILEEFKQKKTQLMEDLHAVYTKACAAINRKTFDKPHSVEITAQGGIGTAKENQFLLDYYKLDSTGWATPFLLVPEATNVDEPTLKKLVDAGEKDLYLSEVSPLGVPFNNLRDNFSDLEKDRRADAGRPGSACPKGHLVSNTEFTDKPICTASRQYQKLKIDQLKTMELSPQAFKAIYDKVITKACICNDLGEAALINNNVVKNGQRFSAVCPGPNMAYFSKVATLKEMVDHIYGRINLLNNTYRPHMFIKELKLYVDYFIKEVQKSTLEPTAKQIEYLNEFRKNMFDGIQYYKQLFSKKLEETSQVHENALAELQEYKTKLEDFIAKHTHIFTDLQKVVFSA